MPSNEKTVTYSKTEQINTVLPKDTNSANRLFGGALMQWMDIVAGIVAHRHSGCQVTTASVDSLNFLAPANQGDLIVLIGKMTYVGNTSMEVRIDAFTETYDGQRQRINRAYFVMVAIDQNNVPVPVPQLVLETEEEKKEWESAQKRQQLRKKRRQEKY
ncbi:MAG: acyl-CoA thioesterase [Christensenellaceae bacterium]|jgi:acyl-CoA hydrolase